MSESITVASLRELDALVAERVLGQIVYWDKAIPEYSKDIAAAWEIAQKLGIALIPQSSGDSFRWFACDIESVLYRGESIEVYEKNDSGVSGDSAPLAICLAALSSIGVEVIAGGGSRIS